MTCWYMEDFCCNRRRKLEQAQQLMLWKIDYEDIDFLSEPNVAKSTVLNVRGRTYFHKQTQQK